MITITIAILDLVNKSFRSGTHGLNEELGRHSTCTRNDSKACAFCEYECESVEHVLWEC